MDTKMSISEAKRRAKELLAQLSPDEKLYQLSSQMIYSVEDDYEQKRNPMQGNYRNPGHFMHRGKKEAITPAQVTERINRDVQMSMDAQPHAIPPIEHGEALHGAQRGMATVFPSPNDGGSLLLRTAVFCFRSAFSLLPPLHFFRADR